MPEKRIELLKGDITRLELDAIVNAANTKLLGGGGVDGAIHRAAGPGLLEECEKLGGCPTGEARLTGGHDLPARWVIHTVGPRWSGGQRNEEQLLANCYRNSLALAAKHGIRSLAFPAISTGAYRFPADKATRIALETTRAFLRDHPEIERVVFACFDQESLDLYRKTLASCP